MSVAYIRSMCCSHCFFFKQKTAYDLRISDCSSDVCSSDLEVRAVAGAGRADHRREQCLVVAHARAAGRGDREGFGPDMADRLDDQPVAPRREDIPPAPFELGHRVAPVPAAQDAIRSEEHTSELQSLMRISYAVSCLKK